MADRPFLASILVLVICWFFAPSDADLSRYAVCVSPSSVRWAAGDRSGAVTVESVGRSADGCARVGGLDLAISQGRREVLVDRLLGPVVNSARQAGIDPRLLLAVLLRESGDTHSFDWLSRTPVLWIHRFTIGVANMNRPAFEEARAYSNGTVNYDWKAIRSDPVKAITAAAYLLAKRRSQLQPRRSASLTDAEYLRIGYRSGSSAMAAAQRTGQYRPGVELFDLAYQTAGRLMGRRDGTAAA